MRNPSKSSAPESAAAVEGGRRTGGPTPCCSKSGVKRGPWTPEEDEVLASFVRLEGEGRWRTLPKRAGLRRCGKSCRLRWMNYLRPSIKHGPIAPDEEDLILRLHRLLGNRWSLIAGRIPGRTDNEIKNYWNTHLSKKLISQGIDPRTHKPLATISSSTPDAIQQPLPSYVSPNPSTDFPNPGLNLHHDDGYADDGGWKESEFVTDAEMGSIDCYTDDIFSSFLDSLINEEVFQQHDHVLANGDLDNVIECNNLSINSTGGGGSNQPADVSASSPVASFGVGSCNRKADHLQTPIDLEEYVHEQFPGDAI